MIIRPYLSDICCVGVCTFTTIYWAGCLSANMVCIMHTMKSKDLINELKAAGWYLDRVNGSHHMLKNAQVPGTVVVPHPKKELGVGLVNSIRKQAGI